MIRKLISLTRWVSLEQTRGSIIIEASDQCGNAKRTFTIGLCVLLFELRNETSNVLHRCFILNSQSMTLTFDTSSVNQNTSIGGQTGKGHHNMVIEQTNFSDSAVFLQFAH